MMTLKTKLAWHRAAATSSYFMNKCECWPDSMTPNQLAALQAPEKCKGFRLDNVLRNAITESCRNGDVPCATEARPSASRLSAPGGRFDPTGTQTAKEVTDQHITAPAFAAWLAAQGETPSVHIQAWFDAVGVAGAAQALPDAPVAVVNSTPTDESLDDRNLRWLNHYETEERTAKRGAYNRTAAHFEVKAPTLRKAVDKARIERTERNRAGLTTATAKRKATPFTGLVTTVKGGKKTTTKQR